MQKALLLLSLLISLSLGRIIGTECRATTLTVETLRNGTGSNQAEIITHIRNAELKLVDPRNNYWSCVDGRSNFGVLGTPGGDIAEFATAISIYSENGGNVTTEEEVMFHFVSFIESLPITRPFYLHTDSHAVEYLVEVLRELLHLPNTTEVDIEDVPSYKQDEFKVAALEAKSIGCGHLRLLTVYPADYQVPFNYTAWSIRVFYDFLWNHANYTRLVVHKSDPRFVVNLGDHEERAVVNIISNIRAGSPKCANLIPLVVPKNIQDSIFINHISHVSVLRDQLISYFSKQPRSIPANEFRRRFDEIGAIQLNLTVGYLAAGRPIFAVTINVEEVNVEVPDNSAAKFGSVLYLLLLLALYLR